MGLHFVPKPYLLGFCSEDSPGVLWQYDKVLRQYTQVTVNTAAQSKRFYPPSVEARLSEQIEAPVNPILQRLREGEQLASSERLPLSTYMATMLMRVPAHRQRARNLVSPTLDKVVSELKALLTSSHLSPEVVASRIAAIDDARIEFERQLPHPLQLKVEAPWPSATIILLIHDMTWRFVTASGPIRYLTSDNPFSFFEGIGLGNENSEFLFPISSSLALFGDMPRLRETFYLQASQRLVREANRRTVKGATRHVFYHERASWLASLAAKSHLELNRIAWAR